MFCTPGPNQLNPSPCVQERVINLETMYEEANYGPEDMDGEDEVGGLFSAGFLAIWLLRRWLDSSKAAVKCAHLFALRPWPVSLSSLSLARPPLPLACMLTHTFAASLQVGMMLPSDEAHITPPSLAKLLTYFLIYNMPLAAL